MEKIAIATNKKEFDEFLINMLELIEEDYLETKKEIEKYQSIIDNENY